MISLIFSITTATENYRHDPQANAHWEDIKSRATEGSDVMNFYLLRKKLCDQIDAGEMTVAEATELFEK